MQNKLVIFDFDGVLVDSEIITHKIRSEEMNRMGLQISVERAIEIFSGVANADLANTINKEYGKMLNKEEINGILEKIGAALRKDLNTIPNMPSFCDHLDKNSIKKCIGSNGGKDYIIQALTWTGLNSYFDQKDVYSASSSGKRRKPMPDIFLHIAEEFQTKPQNCIVIEDSVVGIQAAKSAKMPVIGFLGGGHANNHWYHNCILQAKPDMIANNALELFKLLED